jgi:hypothetical protein
MLPTVIWFMIMLKLASLSLPKVFLLRMMNKACYDVHLELPIWNRISMNSFRKMFLEPVFKSPKKTSIKSWFMWCSRLKHLYWLRLDYGSNPYEYLSMMEPELMDKIVLLSIANKGEDSRKRTFNPINLDQGFSRLRDLFISNQFELPKLPNTIMSLHITESTGFLDLSNSNLKVLALKGDGYLGTNENTPYQSIVMLLSGECQLINLKLENIRIEPKNLLWLTSNRNLKHLTLYNVKMTSMEGEDWRNLTQLLHGKTLTSIKISSKKMSRLWKKILKSVPNALSPDAFSVKVHYCYRPKVKWMKRLLEGAPNLKILQMSYFDRECLDYCAKFKQLARLTCDKSVASYEDFKVLSTLPNLKFIGSMPCPEDSHSENIFSSGWRSLEKITLNDSDVCSVIEHLSTRRDLNVKVESIYKDL